MNLSVSLYNKRMTSCRKGLWCEINHTSQTGNEDFLYNVIETLIERWHDDMMPLCQKYSVKQLVLLLSLTGWTATLNSVHVPALGLFTVCITPFLCVHWISEQRM